MSDLVDTAIVTPVSFKLSVGWAAEVGSRIVVGTTSLLYTEKLQKLLRPCMKGRANQNPGGGSHTRFSAIYWGFHYSRSQQLLGSRGLVSTSGSVKGRSELKGSLPSVTSQRAVRCKSLLKRPKSYSVLGERWPDPTVVSM